MGIDNGRIINEQIRDIVILYQSDVDQNEKLLELLHNKGIYPVSENEFPSVSKSKVANEVCEKKGLAKEERVEILAKRFNRLCKEGSDRLK